MTRVTLVAALGRNHVIGADGGMPWHLPEDFRHFKTLTMGHALIMGRRTFESIGRPLPGRRTIVVTRSPDWSVSGVEVAHSFDEAVALAAGDDEVFVVGGGEIYREALASAHRMVLSHVEAEPVGDTTFPTWRAADWTVTQRVGHEGFEIVTYDRR